MAGSRGEVPLAITDAKTLATSTGCLLADRSSLPAMPATTTTRCGESHVRFHGWPAGGIFVLLTGNCTEDILCRSVHG